VSTPVWIARDGADLVVTTSATSARVKEGAPAIAGNAVIESADEVTAELNDIFSADFPMSTRSSSSWSDSANKARETA
jgi:hypothetical protein